MVYCISLMLSLLLSYFPLRLSLFRIASHFLSLGVIVRLISCNICELLTQILRQHTLNETILPVVCELIYSLILTDLEDYSGSNKYQDKFTEYYVCEQFVNKILINDTTSLSSLSLIWILKAIGSLARHHEENKNRFSNANLFPYLGKLVKEREGILLQDPFFAEAICWAIGNLSFPSEENQLKLGEITPSALSIILDLLQMHSLNRVVIQEGMRALRNLCQDCSPNIEKLITLEGLTFCMELIKLFLKEPDVLQWIMYSLASICENEQARMILGKENITKELSFILQK
jgi:hypothetical protein